MEPLLALVLSLQADPVALENEHVRVTRNGAPCAQAGTPGCAERVVVALAPVEMREPGGGSRKMDRGDVAVFEAGQSFLPPSGGDFLEVALKPEPPPVQAPALLIAPEKNALLYDGNRFFVFEERLEPGDIRPRHSHSQRVVIVLNETRLQQWPEGAPEVFRNQIPNDIRFNPPVVHVVKNVGKNPLRNIVIELKPD